MILVMIVPLIILASGAIFAGYFFKDIFIGHNTNFWQNSIFFLNQLDHYTIPLWLLVLTPIIVVSAIPIAYYYFLKNTEIIENLKGTNIPLYNFLLNKWYIDELYDFIFVKPTKRIGNLLWKKGDIGIIDRFGPDGISKVVKYISNISTKLQSGYIYDYAFVMLIGLSVLITYFILK